LINETVLKTASLNQSQKKNIPKNLNSEAAYFLAKKIAGDDQKQVEELYSSLSMHSERTPSKLSTTTSAPTYIIDDPKADYERAKKRLQFEEAVEVNLLYE